MHVRGIFDQVTWDRFAQEKPDEVFAIMTGFCDGFYEHHFGITLGAPTVDVDAVCRITGDFVVLDLKAEVGPDQYSVIVPKGLADVRGGEISQLVQQSLPSDRKLYTVKYVSEAAAKFSPEWVIYASEIPRTVN